MGSADGKVVAFPQAGWVVGAEVCVRRLLRQLQHRVRERVGGLRRFTALAQIVVRTDGALVSNPKDLRITSIADSKVGKARRRRRGGMGRERRHGKARWIQSESYEWTRRRPLHRLCHLVICHHCDDVTLFIDISQCVMRHIREEGTDVRVNLSRGGGAIAQQDAAHLRSKRDLQHDGLGGGRLR